VATTVAAIATITADSTGWPVAAPVGKSQDPGVRPGLAFLFSRSRGVAVNAAYAASGPRYRVAPHKSVMVSA